ncbi:ABC transporter ATP-binding protein [Bowdeniella nasicola]|uniref:ABC transporter ATP-binding protein n=1 Tax=Bowdeniella nasicola TaxID=208480 RepID=UPI0013017223|nr:ABC transporter ATP-binding protein [Bowdeniella nasicola]
MTMVCARDVSVSIDDVSLLAPTSFELDAGYALALTGLNGSGKTTLLRVVAGKQQPSSGTLTVAGHAPSDRDPAFRERLAALLGLPPLAHAA